MEYLVLTPQGNGLDPNEIQRAHNTTRTWTWGINATMLNSSKATSAFQKKRKVKYTNFGKGCGVVEFLFWLVFGF